MLVELDAGSGKFVVANAGGRREDPFIFFYGDQTIQFFFNTSWDKLPGRGIVIDVYEGNVERFRGGLYIESSRLVNIKANIIFAFMNRDFFILKDSINETEEPSEVNFSWGVS
jgi:hypothetical protein